MKDFLAAGMSDITHASAGARMQHTLRLAKRYATSYYRSRGERDLFREVTTFSMFIGHARSGHSIMGALLDAHPAIVLPDEVDVLQYVAAGFNREQIFHLLLARSRRQAAKGRIKRGRSQKVYSYRVPGQWQGRHDRLRVMGDSKAGKTTQRLAQDPALLRRVQRVMGGATVKLIHVVRNPYDNISTLMLRGGRSFQNATQRYFLNCKTLAELQGRVPTADLLLVRQEDFLANPRAQLNELCRWLGVAAPEDYLEACVGILYKSAAKSRHKIEWRPEWIAEVDERMVPFDFLNGYSYET